MQAKIYKSTCVLNRHLLLFSGYRLLLHNMDYLQEAHMHAWILEE